MGKNFKELARLLDKVAPAELPVVNIGDIIAEEGPRLIANLCLSRNFADANIGDVLNKVVDKRDSLKDFVNSLREELHKLTWNVTEEEMLALQNSGESYTPEDVVYVKLNDKQLIHLPAIVWLETGYYDEAKENCTAGLIHMLFTGNADRTGHYKDLKKFISGLDTFNDLFVLLDFLLSGDCEQEINIVRKTGSVHATVLQQKQLTPTLIIQPAKYVIPIGDNGFLVSLYPNRGKSK